MIKDIKDIPEIKSLPLYKKKAQFTPSIVKWYQIGKRSLPWRELWQRHNDPYHIWVSEIMLQQTLITAVLPAYQRFLDTFPDVNSLAQADEQDVRLACRGLGYYRRFRLMHEAAKKLLALSDHSQPIAWPRSFKDWKLLPGIGDYTAAAIASIAFNEAVPVVDGNVERVFCRLLDIRLAPNLPKLKKFFFALNQDLICQKDPGDYNQAVMELGQTVCTKQNPNCSACPLQWSCLAYKNNSQALAPQTKHNTKLKELSLKVYIPFKTKTSQIALIKRPASARFLKETWGFPTAIVGDNGKAAWDGEQRVDIDRRSSKLLGQVSHAITNHKLSIEARLLTLEASKALRWLDIHDVEEQLVSNLDRKALRLLQKALPL